MVKEPLQSILPGTPVACDWSIAACESPASKIRQGTHLTDGVKFVDCGCAREGMTWSGVAVVCIASSDCNSGLGTAGVV